MTEDIGERILQELKEHNPKKHIRKLVIVVLVAILAASSSLLWDTFKPQAKAMPSWTEVNRASDVGDLQQALEMAKVLLKKTPNSHRAHASLGSIYLAMGNAEEAAKCYARAYELFPDSTYADTIRTVKQIPGSGGTNYDASRLGDSKRSESTCVVVADDDLPIGTRLGTNNVSERTMLNTDLGTDGWVSVRDWNVLIGHTLRFARKSGEPIRWSDTDIMIASGNKLQTSSAGGASNRTDGVVGTPDK